MAIVSTKITVFGLDSLELLSNVTGSVADSQTIASSHWPIGQCFRLKFIPRLLINMYEMHLKEPHQNEIKQTTEPENRREE